MKLRHTLFAAMSVFLLAATQASAQDCSTFDRTEFDANLQAADTEISTMEQLAAKFLSSGSMSPKEEDMMNGLMQSYAGHLFNAYQIANEATNLAARSEGSEGDARLLTEFELAASTHEGRVTQFVKQAEKIDAAVTQGQIKEASLLPQGTPTQILTLRPGYQGIVNEGLAEQNSLPGMCRSAAKTVGNLIIPTAEAAQIWPCVSPCSQKKWTECFQCIAKAAPQMISAWNNFQSCWNASSKWWKRAWCLAQFIAKLA